ncbi:hypothetical protein ABE288_05790 [Bacillus salipaludis]|uniref:hypothetical protein n=1 Tax=Bacillus salipaludis TaxID=2547811 RepID=UPI003D20DA3C
MCGYLDKNSLKHLKLTTSATNFFEIEIKAVPTCNIAKKTMGTVLSVLGIRNE